MRILTFLLLINWFGINSYSQDEQSEIKDDYLTIQSGLIIDGYNSLGVRTFFEYQKKIKNKWYYGLSYEHSRHLGFFINDQLNELNSNLSQLSLNGYYKLSVANEKLFWLAGVGLGALHNNWDNHDSFGISVNASFTLNIKLSKRLYLETSPLIILLPVNRVYYSPMNADEFDDFYALTYFPFGLKVKL
ncbi:hypothetical protein [Carboxylicivirga caseinilyticus]|uniref:hypothetical protein n=1 Tax=Carboxylicivirga caseinilyticus TaxID=3417572 RepID=UPI003D3284F5|nr:hypothetical protein [Marinilabiliaceae bacterium A049]